MSTCALPSVERSESERRAGRFFCAESDGPPRASLRRAIVEGPPRADCGGQPGQSIVGAAHRRSARRSTKCACAKKLTATETLARKEAKPAYKPGSVTARDVARYDRHSSRPAVTDGLEPPTRGLGEQRRRPPIWRCSGWRLPRFTRSQKGSDSSLWPCSSPLRRPRGLGYMRPGVTRHPALWSPDFPLPRNDFRSSDDLAGFAARL